MFDNVNFWIDRVNISGGRPIEILPYLSEVEERKNDRYRCYVGRLKNYTVFVAEHGISLKGSLPKNYFGDNLHTLTRQDVKRSIDELGDCLHTDISPALVTRLDVSNILYTKRPPSDYYAYLGQKPYFERLQSTPDTLYYNNHQRQIIFYDKTKEATAKDVQIHEVLQSLNLLRYELRYTKRISKQLNTDLTAAKLYDTDFYRRVVQRWYDEFKTIQKLKKQGFMTNKINTVKDAEMALFASFLQQSGQSTIDEFLAELKAKGTFKERQRYSELKKRLNTISSTFEYAEKSDMIQELETQAFDIARYAR